MKYALATAAVLLFASAASAQNGSLKTSSTAPSMVGGVGGGYGTGSGFGGFGGANAALPYEAPHDFALVYGTNDGPFVPSTFMKYEDGVAFGKAEIARQQAEAASSLGEKARAYRAAKVPTMKLDARVSQDDGGKVQVCNLNGNTCRHI